MRSELQFDLDGQSIENKMLEFKANEDKMIEMNKFVDEVLMDAQQLAQQQCDAREVLRFSQIYIRLS